MKVVVTVPNDYLGNVTGDISSRRGMIIDTEDRGVVKLVTAEIPLSELFGYTTSSAACPRAAPAHHGVPRVPRHALVLDGLPRTVRQVDLIRDHVDVTCVVHLIAKDREKMVQRLRGRALKEKRFDDAKEEVVRNRLDIYDRETRPVLDRFDQGLVKNVDAVGSPGAVLKAILDVVTPIQEARFGNSLEG
jgi:hypothetical protein